MGKQDVTEFPDAFEQAIAEQAKQLTQEQMEKAAIRPTNINILLDNAKNLADVSAKIGNGTTQPNNTFYVTAPTVQAAADQVEKHIKRF